MRKNPSKFKPFSEWVLVYFDKSIISEEKILGIIKKRCSGAKIARDKEVKIGSSSVTVLNPYLGPGDSIAVKVTSDGSEKIELKLTEGWTHKMPEKITGTMTIFVRSDSKASQGKYKIKFKSGSEVKELDCSIVKKCN